MAILEVIRGPDSGSSFHVHSDELTIGRSSRADISLSDRQVSGHHARLTRDGDRYVLADLGSSNGTFINGHRVKEVPLQSGDEIALGQTVIRYTEAAAQEDAELIPASTETIKDDDIPALEPWTEEPTPQPAQGGEPERAASLEELPLPTEPEPAEVRAVAPPPAPAEPSVVRPADGDAHPAPSPPSTASIGNRATRAGIWPKVYRIRLGKRLIEAPLRKRIARKLVCPNCWHSFPPDEVHFISKHPELLGDPVVGPDEYRRFLPKRFTVSGEALDERGFPTTEPACPRCHLQLPEAALEVFPLFISIIGPPACGKSYFLTTMTWELRQLMPRFWLSFSDTDPVANSAIHDYERTLFLNPRPDEPTEIRKTQADDPRLHRIVQIGGVQIRFPIPLQFALWPTPDHPRFSRAHRVGRNVVFYENAGEDFLPRVEEARSAAVQHLARSEILLVLFDPTQDPRLRPYCSSDDPQLSAGLRPGSQQTLVQVSQETIMREVAVRVRRYLHLPQDRQIKKPLIVVVPKFDVLADVPGVSLDEEPYVEAGDNTPMQVKVDVVEQTSESLRAFLRRLCPEFVATAESLSTFVRYVPVTSLGGSPTIVRRGEHTFYGIRPKEIRPKWVTVPLLYCLCTWGPKGLLSTN